MSYANNITFAQAKTSFFYRPKVKSKYNTLHLAGKEVCKKDEVFLVLFELNINLLYGRYPKSRFSFLPLHGGLGARTRRRGGSEVALQLLVGACQEREVPAVRLQGAVGEPRVLLPLVRVVHTS